MPVIGDPQPVQLFPAMINVPTESGLFVTVQVQSDGSQDATAMIPQVVQELTDLMQSWPGRQQIGNVSAQIYDVELSMVGPTDPVDQQPTDPPEGRRAS